MKIMKISHREVFQRIFYLFKIIHDQALMKKPFERDGSYAFFKCIKKNDMDLFNMFIKRCRYYVYDINHQFKTCLHLVASKGYLDICQKILELGCEIDKEDFLERTPLYYAIKNGHYNIIQV